MRYSNYLTFSALESYSLPSVSYSSCFLAFRVSRWSESKPITLLPRKRTFCALVWPHDAKSSSLQSKKWNTTNLIFSLHLITLHNKFDPRLYNFPDRWNKVGAAFLILSHVDAICFISSATIGYYTSSYSYLFTFPVLFTLKWQKNWSLGNLAVSGSKRKSIWLHYPLSSFRFLDLKSFVHPDVRSLFQADHTISQDASIFCGPITLSYQLRSSYNTLCHWRIPSWKIHHDLLGFYIGFIVSENDRKEKTSAYIRVQINGNN